MRPRAIILLAALVATALAAPAAASAATPPAPAWALSMTPMPANFAPGETAELVLVATNVGGAPTAGTVSVQATLPVGLKPIGVEIDSGDPDFSTDPSCDPIAGQAVSCQSTDPLHPGRQLGVLVEVEVEASGGELEAQASVQGGGGGEATAGSAVPISTEAVPFGFLSGFAAPANNADGSPATLAGSHPYQLTTSLSFPTERIGIELVGTEHPRDLRIDLPRGLLGNPAATPVLCTEAELTSESSPGCPEESQVGTVEVTSSAAGGETSAGTATSALFNMAPPPGAVAELGFNAVRVGLFIHLIAGVRTDGDYGAYTTSNDLLALGTHPIFNVQAQIWGDPSSAAHDQTRGEVSCLVGGGSCEVDRQETAFLTMPGDCPGDPLGFEASADSWEQPGAWQRDTYESADLQGAPVSIEDCAALQYGPQVKAQPTTTLADSPSGLDFELHQPQQGPEAEPLAGRASAALKDATVTFPPGLAVNPAQAAGLEACGEAEIGYAPAEGKVRFDKAPQSCPEAAKIATFKAASPLLAQYDEATHEPKRDPETGAAIPRVLEGSVYLAEPFANPFDSLIAAYFAIEDEKTGIVAKLAGEGELDPATGQLTVRVSENPELPIEDIGVHVFGGDRGAFITPPTCATHQTTTDLVPWSAPEGLPAHPADSFAPSAAPGGGPCPASEAQMPNSPALSAGTTPPQAAKYATLLFRVSRQDGSQRLARIEATLPPGLTAKLAGVEQCSEADIAKARSREAPEQGAAEIADPSCPPASRIGSVDVAAGAGPSPYHAGGAVYLTGPYEGAPLSFAVIAPAVAGPFDLGTVVSRVAVYLDPETARPRAVSDPIPQIIDGVPLDVRQITVRVERPSFTLNPTSCDEESFSGSATSALGAVAPLSERFQVGGCASLPYKPKLSARLFGPTHRGAHPRLRAIFTARPGEANTARVSFALPHSEFIDQAHFRTICTRVQFAAKACPKGSVYGHMKAITPLLGYPLRGPVYLRSSSHELPDVVAALHGPPSQPVEVDLVGRVDSVNGGVRTIFAAVPDAPVSKAIITMQGNKKGLFQNSTNICKGAHRITLKLNGQNGKTHDSRPKLKASCPKPKHHKPKGHSKGRRR